MIVIRRLVDRHRAYTGIFLRGEPPQIFPTSDQEHARILQIYKQDRPHQDVINDFSDYALGRAIIPSPHLRTSRPPADTVAADATVSRGEIEPAAQGPRRDENDASGWLVISGVSRGAP